MEKGKPEEEKDLVQELPPLSMAQLTAEHPLCSRSRSIPKSGNKPTDITAVREETLFSSLPLRNVPYIEVFQTRPSNSIFLQAATLPAPADRESLTAPAYSAGKPRAELCHLQEPRCRLSKLGDFRGGFGYKSSPALG